MKQEKSEKPLPNEMHRLHYINSLPEMNENSYLINLKYFEGIARAFHWLVNWFHLWGSTSANRAETGKCSRLADYLTGGVAWLL